MSAAKLRSTGRADACHHLPANLRGAPTGAFAGTCGVTMRYVLMWLAMIFAAGAAAADTSGLRAFYCIHAERSCAETKALVPVSARDAKALAQRALATKDDFVGFVDAQETTLQFYVEATDSILVDMPVPKMQGSYATHMTRAQAVKLIARLAPPLSRYRARLQLVFAKWQ